MHPLTRTCALALLLAASTNAAHAQGGGSPDEATRRIDVCATPSQTSLKAIQLHNVEGTNDGNEIQTAVRNLVPPNTRIFYVSNQSVLYMCGTPEQQAVVERIIRELDKPKPSYRVTFTLTEIDSGKRLGSEHESLIVTEGQRMNAKQGTRVPILVGALPQDNYQYVDIGLNIDVTVTGIAGGAFMKAKIEQSSLADEKAGARVEGDPIIRQTSLEGSPTLTFGKPLILGSIDIPNSTRHIDVEAMVEELK